MMRTREIFAWVLVALLSGLLVFLHRPAWRARSLTGAGISIHSAGSQVAEHHQALNDHIIRIEADQGRQSIQIQLRSGKIVLAASTRNIPGWRSAPDATSETD